MTSISILGAGWLGLPLATALKEQGYAIVLSKRSAEDVDKLAAQGWNTARFSLGDSVSGKLISDIAIINIPSQRRTVNANEFSQHIIQLCDTLLRGGTQQVVFVSTTSVYGEQQGCINHQTEPFPTTESSKAHFAIEQHLLTQYPSRSCVLRLAGLVGGERHPVKFLAGKQDLPKPHDCVNLIHRQDVITAIKAILNENAWGEVLLLSATDHPTRQDYYRWAALQLNLIPPEFSVDTSSEYLKKIDASATLSRLKIQLAFPSPYHMLPLV